MISGPIRYCKRLAPEALKRPIRKWMHARWHAKAARAQIAYYEAREQEIRRVLGSPAILQTFLKSEALPKNYGRGLDERIVEYPWLMSRLGNRSSKLLDLGSTLNHECSGATSFHDLPRSLDGDQPIASMSIAALQFTTLGRA